MLAKNDGANKARKERLVEIVNEIANQLGNELPQDSKLQRVFKKCFVNTVETTVECINEDEIFIITGDIEAMWLRDSSAQVMHYLPFANQYPEIGALIKALVLKQFEYIGIDPYANAFNIAPSGDCWDHDITENNPWNWERKYEIDSLCYPIKLLYQYWKETKDTSIFTSHVKDMLYTIIELWRTEQYHDTKSPYSFVRLDCPPTDTLVNDGKGTPTAYTGMIWSGFRPSDDACKYGYLVPSNMFAVVVLGYVVEFANEIFKDEALAKEAAALRDEIEEGINKYAIVHHETLGDIYAYEVDGFGNYNLMDDANVPSLLSIPWLGYRDCEDELYKNTRNFVLSKENPYYYEGKAAKGIGSPHTPDQYVWHIALSMQGLTSACDTEREELVEKLLATDAGTDYMHEGFYCENPEEFTRPWFAWSNSLFALFALRFVLKK